MPDHVAPEKKPSPASPQILIVDDQPVNLLALGSVLAPLGAEIVTAHSGYEALKQVLKPENDFAAILLDVQMPGMDGFEVARLIKERARSRYIPILFITAANDNPTFIFSAYSAGAVDFLPKPFVPEVLKAKVSVFIDLYLEREKARLRERMLRQSEQREEQLRQRVREQEREQHHFREMAEREAEKAALAARVQEMANEMAQRQRRFLREMLSSLTEGRLQLCNTAEELPPPLPALSEPVALSVPTLRVFRKQTKVWGEAAGWDAERLHDFVTAVGEAAMNAVVHGREARGMVRGRIEENLLQVWIEDEGGGIAEDSLHRATLERGFTTAGTLGHGFWLMLRTCERLYLLTGETGTTLVLEQGASAPDPGWLQSFLGMPVAETAAASE